MSKQDLDKTTNSKKSTFSDFNSVLREVISANEIDGDIRNAYKLSSAGGKSGYSFAVHQRDIRTDTRNNANGARQVFLDIMQNAKDQNGKKIISNDFLKKIANFDNNGKIIGGDITAKAADKKISTVDLILINSALASEYGQSKLQQDFTTEMKRKTEYVNRIIGKITNQDTKEFLQSNDTAKIILIDYHNQFNIGKKGKMEQFLNNFDHSNKISIEKIRNFIANTKYALKKPKDFVRRQENIDKICSKYALTVKQELAPECKPQKESNIVKIVMRMRASLSKERTTNTVLPKHNRIISSFNKER